MTQAVHDALPRGRWQQHSLVGGVSLAHFVSHFYFMVLPPLFLFVRNDYHVSYTELGLALSVFNLVSAVFQTPIGFLVDKVGARLNLIAGLLLGAVALAIAGLVDSYWVLIAMFGVLGLANTVYHPADYAMLSHHVAPERMLQAYSVHTFSGMMGSAVAPGVMLFLTGYVGWRGAFGAAAALGVLSAIVLMLQRDPPVRVAPTPSEKSVHPTGWRLLVSTPILLNLLFFTLISMISGGLYNYLVVALNELHGVPLDLGATALSTMLFTTAGGVLIGGLLLTRTTRHVLVANICLWVSGIASLLIGLADFGTIGLLALVTIIGLTSGAMAPSRDMIVRAATPPGAYGTVFGFVTNGYSIAGVIAPLMFGLMMDHSAPRWIFISVAVSCVLCALSAIAAGRGKPAPATVD